MDPTMDQRHFAALVDIRQRIIAMQKELGALVDERTGEHPNIYRFARSNMSQATHDLAEVIDRIDAARATLALQIADAKAAQS